MATKILQITFILFAFTLPLSRGAFNFFFALSLLFWVLEGNFKEKIALIKERKIVWVFLLIALLTFLSALFSSSYHNGFLAGENKSIFKVIITHYFLVPLIIVIMASSIKKRTLKLAISAFLAAIFLSEIASYLVFFHLIDVDYFKSIHIIYKFSTVENPSPFMQHVEYSVYLSIAILFLLQQLLTTKNRWLKVFMLLFFTSATINLFINGGRTGQLIYILSMLTYTLLYFRMSLKSLLITIITLVGIIAVAYNSSSTFYNRTHQAASDINEMLHGDFNTSWGSRAASTIVTLDFLTSSPKNFILGAGAGDTRQKYLEHAKEHFTPNYYGAIAHLAHTHNQYLEYWMDGTIFSLLLFLLYFILLLKLKVPQEYKPLLYAFAVAVIVAASTDVPLFRYQPAMLIMFLTGYFITLACKNKSCN